MARDFAGAGNYLHCPTPVTAAGFVVSLWFKAPGSDTIRVILSLRDTAVADNYWLIQTQGFQSDDIAVVANDGTASGSAVAVGGYTPEVWTHVLYRERHSSLRVIYVDGVNIDSDSTTVNPTSIDALWLGQHTLGDYAGEIAEVAIWDAPLPNGDIPKMAESLAAGFSPLLVRPEGLAFYAPLINDEDYDVIGAKSFTEVGSVGLSGHPPIVRPASPLYTPPTPAAEGLDIEIAAHQYIF